MTEHGYSPTGEPVPNDRQDLCGCEGCLHYEAVNRAIHGEHYRAMTHSNEKACGPDHYSWFARGTWPRCACGFDPRDNAVLNEHWREQGFRVVDDHGTLVRQVWSEPLAHYFDDCGGPVDEDRDVWASEPWDVTCPACKEMGS